MNAPKINYRERIPASRRFRFGAALVVALLFYWALWQNVNITSDRTAALIPALLFILAVTYFRENIFSSKSRKSIVLFPTGRPDELQALLAAAGGGDSDSSLL